MNPLRPASDRDCPPGDAHSPDDGSSPGDESSGDESSLGDAVSRGRATSGPQASAIVWHEPSVGWKDRERRLGQRGVVVWFTGLSGCGKSTVANELDRQLQALGAATMLLDGDNIRHGLCAPPERLAEEYGRDFAERFGLGFGPTDREENLRRVAAVASLMASAGLITLTAFVSPYRRDRERVRRTVEASGRPGDFFEVFVDTPLSVCEARDPKGLYRRARAGEIRHFTGISDPYEPPLEPEIRLDGGRGLPAETLAEQVLNVLRDRGVLGPAG